METLRLVGKPGNEIEVTDFVVKIQNKIKRVDKVIPLANVISVQVKRKGLTPGYIYFQTVGGLDTNVKSVNEVLADENSWIIISKTDYEIALKIKERIELFAAHEISETLIASEADEIAKFKSLLDLGAITQEEYNVKKRQLLDL